MNTILNSVKRLLVLLAFGISLCVILYNEYTNSPISAKKIVVSLQGVMTDKSVSSVVQALNRAGSQDTVIINIDSNGGEVSAFYLIQDAIKNTKAKHVIGEVLRGHMALSAAAFVFIVCPEKIVEDGSLFMVHKPSYPVDSSCTDPEKCLFTKVEYGPDPFMNSILDVTNHVLKISRQECILSDQEIHDVMYNDKDLFILGSELKLRLETCS